MTTTKGFYDAETEGESLGVDITDGVYHLRAGEGTVDEWDDGRPRLATSTTIACGRYEGLFGPRIQLTAGASAGVSKTGRPFEISEEDAAKRIRVTVKAVHPAPIALSNPESYDGTMLEEIADALPGSECGGRINHKNGYTNLQAVFPLAEPPKGFKCECSVEAFSL